MAHSWQEIFYSIFTVIPYSPILLYVHPRKLTAKAPENMAGPKRKGSPSNHQFKGNSWDWPLCNIDDISKQNRHAAFPLLFLVVLVSWESSPNTVYMTSRSLHIPPSPQYLVMQRVWKNRCHMMRNHSGESSDGTSYIIWINMHV